MFYALTEVDEIGLSMLQTGLYGEGNGGRACWENAPERLEN
jgi:hypothetical protein